MRNIVMGVCAIGFFLLVLLVGGTVSMRQKRETELEAAVNLAMEQALQSVVYDDGDSPENDEKLCVMFEELLIAQLSANAAYRIDILDASAQKGLLSAAVTERYAHINGRTGCITVQKTAICEQTAKENKYGYRTIIFYVGEQIFRRYELGTGSTLPVPGTPQEEGRIFSGWRNLTDGKLYQAQELQEMVLDEDMDFYAQWQ